VTYDSLHYINILTYLLTIAAAPVSALCHWWVASTRDDGKFCASYQCWIIQGRWHTMSIYRLTICSQMHSFMGGLPWVRRQLCNNNCCWCHLCSWWLITTTRLMDCWANWQCHVQSKAMLRRSGVCLVLILSYLAILGVSLWCQDIQGSRQQMRECFRK